MTKSSGEIQQIDPRGLIREAFSIEGISEPECRSIFLDWAIGFPAADDAQAAIRHLLATYTDGNHGHPMIAVLSEGLGDAPSAQRRGGRRGRQVSD